MLRLRLAVLSVLIFGLSALAQTPESKPAESKPQEPPAKAPESKPQEPKAPTTAPLTPATPPAAPAPVAQFQLKLEKNKAFFQKITTTVQQTIKVQGGADLAQKHEQTFFFKWLPVDQVGEKWIVKQTIEGAKMTIDIAGNQVKYDSTSTGDSSGSAPGLADFFSKLVGSEFTVTFGKGMAVEKVDGREEFLKKLGGVNAAMENILKKMLTEDALRQMVDPSFGISPPTEQKDGGSWEKTTTHSLGPIGAFELKNKYTYKGKDSTQKELDRIEVSSTVTYKPPTEQTDGLLFKIKGGELKSLDPTPDQAANNYILYDPQIGRVVKANMLLKMKGTLNVSIGATDTTIELNQEQTTTVETRDTSFLEPKK